MGQGQGIARNVETGHDRNHPPHPPAPQSQCMPSSRAGSGTPARFTGVRRAGSADFSPGPARTALYSRRMENPDDPTAHGFLRYMEVERNASPRTLQGYGASLAAFRAACRNFTAWEDCQPADFRQWLFELMKEENRGPPSASISPP